MHYLGEIISLAVAVSWTFSAVFAETASKRLTPLILNVVRMTMALVLLSLTILFFTGSATPLYADGYTWLWLLVSGIVGYVVGDTCLFNAYVIIGSRFGQLFMTLSPPTAAICGYLFLGEKMSMLSIFGMFITVTGIGISVMNKGEHHGFNLRLPIRGMIYAIGAGMCTGGGLVLSKIGINHYEQLIPSGATSSIGMIPVTATFIRSVAGLAGFLLIFLFRNERHYFRKAVCDKTGMLNAVGMTIFGPFIGVSLSLMAVQYTTTGIASTLMALTPVIIILPSHFFYHQKIKAREIAGAVIAVIGVSIFFL